jgi:hypothetical protein
MNPDQSDTTVRDALIDQFQGSGDRAASLADRAIATIRRAERERIAALRAEYDALVERERERHHPEPKKGRYTVCVGCWWCCGSFKSWAGDRLHEHVLRESSR